MIGMDRHTGQPISGIEHVRQSIEDILTTPLGSRRQRPEYGSQLRRFVDLPVTEGWKSAVQAEVARALGRWEPRLKLSQVRVIAVLNGRIEFELKGLFKGETALVRIAA
ncbi:GPW/gp25 family protein [Pseudomonas fluorescens]|uniref:GPW/gp25 family protein n=1 Tax=Pseudomonas fluorescens TaxID=294 RepID=UPI0015C753DE|nr:GPW/gp25 family protein [Pseudomonas fluorescens]MBD8091731.1 GPW/gp25 family protein [Pseudomonas fluorescens]MBD8716146.1 GPW/gp25 family protein [Pseudomonas fluorescens]QLG93279.1 GPW/gp25 family protein [Pseudomonas yamanorum]